MGLNCGCPASAHLADLNIAECKESMGQIQKVIFQRIYNKNGVLNGLTVEELTQKASMTPFFSASDSTKMVVSPYIQNPTTEPGAARTFGGGNQTLGGVELIIGREPTTFNGIIYQENQITIAQMKQYMCENIGVYLIDENGNIGCQSPSPDKITPVDIESQKVRPIPIGKLFIGDKKLGGFEEPDSNTIEWSFFPNWSDNFVIIKHELLDYNPLTDLVNVVSA